jgi:hypothetical protein
MVLSSNHAIPSGVYIRGVKSTVKNRSLLSWREAIRMKMRKAVSLQPIRSRFPCFGAALAGPHAAMPPAFGSPAEGEVFRRRYADGGGVAAHLPSPPIVKEP